MNTASSRAVYSRASYSRAEYLSDAVVHVTGLAMAAGAVPVLIVLAALLRGGGESDADRLAVRATDPTAIANAIADCFASLA